MKKAEDPTLGQDGQKVRKDASKEQKELQGKQLKDSIPSRKDFRDEIDKQTPDFSRVSKKDALDFGSSSYVRYPF